MTKFQHRMLQCVSGNFKVPDVVLRSLYGVPTVQTELDLYRLRFLELLLSGRNQACHRQLCEEYVVWARERDPRFKGWLWWDDTHALLQQLQRYMPAYLNLPTAVSQLLQDKQTLSQSRVATETWEAVWEALLRLEQHRRRKDIAEHTSLHDMADILDTPNIAPFVFCDTRSKATTLRITARGGVLAWFGHVCRNLPVCPLCMSAGQFHVKHLVVECPALSACREAAWREAHRILVTCTVRTARFDPATDQQNWYRLTLGAAVPDSFARMGLMRETHFASESLSASLSTRVKRNVQAYRQVLKVTGYVLEAVDSAVRFALITQFGFAEADVGGKRWKQRRRRQGGARR